MKTCPKCGAPEADVVSICTCCNFIFPDAKKRLELNCLIGFICSILAVISTVTVVWVFDTISESADSRSSSVQIIGFLLGLIAGVIFPVVGMIFSIKGIKKSSRPLVTGKGFGIAGIVLSSTMLIPALIFAIILVLFVYFLIEQSFY